MTPRYPHIRVAVRSPNPLTAISAIRGALRHAGVARHEIAAFSQEAFCTEDLDHLREVCRDWVDVEVPAWAGVGTGGDKPPRWPPPFAEA